MCLCVPQGLAIGNGLTVPGTQFPAYGDFAYDNKLIDDYLHNSIKWWSPYCSWAASVCDAYDWRFVCVIALEFCQATIFERILAANPGINVYDITKKCEGSLCYGEPGGCMGCWSVDLFLVTYQGWGLVFCLLADGNKQQGCFLEATGN